MSATPHLQKQLRELTLNPPAGFRVEADANVFQWTVWFSGPQDTPYEGGQFKAQMSFTKEFPMEPPTFRILSDFWHPNVYADGRVCISILHPPGVDEMNTEETAMMRWTPVQTVRSVLLSIISLLSDPDPKDAGAPANVDALVMYRKDKEAYDRRCREVTEKSKRELPEDFVPPTMVEKSEPPPSTRVYGYSGVDDDDDFGFTTPAVAAASGASKYLEELGQIRAMGVPTEKTDEELLQMLQECRGDLATVLEKLF